jgi:excisionase family DNA binding protein
VEPLAVSVKEAAELLGVSPFTIRRRIRSGALKIAHIGRRVVVPVDSLRALLDQQPSSATGDYATGGGVSTWRHG